MKKDNSEEKLSDISSISLQRINANSKSMLLEDLQNSNAQIKSKH